MEYWIFQSNPDKFKIDEYIEGSTDIIWTIRQKHFIESFRPGDEVFIWRAAGESKSISGIIAQGIITDIPKEMLQDEASIKFRVKGTVSTIDWRVPITLEKKCLSSKTVMKRKWVQDDPILSDIEILNWGIKQITASVPMRLPDYLR